MEFLWLLRYLTKLEGKTVPVNRKTFSLQPVSMYNWEAGSLVITVPNKVGGENCASQQENILTAACQYVQLGGGFFGYYGT